MRRLSAQLQNIDVVFYFLGLHAVPSAFTTCPFHPNYNECPDIVNSSSWNRCSTLVCSGETSLQVETGITPPGLLVRLSRTADKHTAKKTLSSLKVRPGIFCIRFVIGLGGAVGRGLDCDSDQSSPGHARNYATFSASQCSATNQLKTLVCPTVPVRLGMHSKVPLTCVKVIQDTKPHS